MQFRGNEEYSDKMKCPCYKCRSRKLGCHAKCRAYGGYRRQIETANKYNKKMNERTRAELSALYWSYVTSKERKLK